MAVQIATGPMWSGKTSCLMDWIQAIEKNGYKPLVIKHVLDKRYNSTDNESVFIVSHDGRKYPAEAYQHLSDIPQEKIDATTFICIDEAQFFPDLMEFCLTQKKNQKEILVAGLSKDYNKKSFGQIDQLTAHLDIGKTKDMRFEFTAKCACGKKAIHTFLKEKSKDKTNVIIGGSELYEPVCNKCYDKKTLG